jgi:hypothetical protein
LLINSLEILGHPSPAVLTAHEVAGLPADVRGRCGIAQKLVDR